MRLTDEQTDKLLIGNMLSFYEQRLAYQEQADELRAYNLEKPLVGVHWQQSQRRSKDVRMTISAKRRLCE